MRNLDLWDINKILPFTYGTSRVGDTMFAAKLSQSVNRLFRLLYLKDPVALYPPTTIDRTKPPNINETGAYAHYGYTIWYKTAYPVLELYQNQKCENPEDAKCDDNGNDPAQHYAYFGYKQSDYDAYTC
ncbi:hypothetical protein WR25_25514 [Diploscapter pachys]|uniref:Fungal lipase-like domain-containing protein n=1 Tax=Diploscapter pachys TaxID=2018661 RepID=A0A2A2JFK9_9BILA|nr:hypothetical protein WR25_25514 [Diploscapter pachys]